MSAIALPAALRKFEGRISDVDSHEMMPAQEWVRHFGPEVQAFADAWSLRSENDRTDKNHPSVPDYPGDILPVGPDIGDVKGARAPGAMEPARRLEVMDAMGIRRQLMFPSGVGMHSFFMLSRDKNYKFLESIGGDRHALAKQWITLYNEWGIGAAKTSDRLRPALPVFGDTVEELIANARYLIKSGIRALWISSSQPPGGKSPASAELDPFWAMLAEADCVAALHAGTEGRFLHTDVWKEAEAFEGHLTLSEFAADPWSMSIFHWPSQNFLATIVNGGVFARHPKLRFGIFEVGGHWIGPMMESLDNWYKSFSGFAPSHTFKLPKLPSEYIHSNVRVAVFPFEDVGMYIERHGLDDIFCFSTDYPHVEGGGNALSTFYDKIQRLGPDVVEKFFVTNGQYVLPD